MAERNAYTLIASFFVGAIGMGLFVLDEIGYSRGNVGEWLILKPLTVAFVLLVFVLPLSSLVGSWVRFIGSWARRMKG